MRSISFTGTVEAGVPVRAMRRDEINEGEEKTKRKGGGGPGRDKAATTHVEDSGASAVTITDVGIEIAPVAAHSTDV